MFQGAGLSCGGLGSFCKKCGQEYGNKDSRSHCFYAMLADKERRESQNAGGLGGIGWDMVTKREGWLELSFLLFHLVLYITFMRSLQEQ